MISLKELRVKLSSKDGFAPKSEDEKRFRDKHKVQAHPDRNGNGDEVFKASKVKTYEREKEHGYGVDKDQDVYEDVEHATDFIGSPARIKNLAKKTIVKIQEGGMPSSVIKTRERYADMSHKEFADLHGHKSKQKLEDMAWRHGYGKGSQFYVDKVEKGRSSTNEQVEEGVTFTRDDWKKHYEDQRAQSSAQRASIPEKTYMISHPDVDSGKEKEFKAKYPEHAKNAFMMHHKNAKTSGFNYNMKTYNGLKVKTVNEDVELDERTLSSSETAEREKIVKGMKKKIAGFKRRYGERAKSVMYATATKMAKGD